MRNLFDQYNHPENRLTHALVSALYHDPKLLKRFVRWAAPAAFIQEPFTIIEQSLPGKEEAVEEEAPERRGLPDAWIYNEATASTLLIESKIMCALSGDQIKRHLGTAKKRGFLRCALLLLCLQTGRRKLPKGVFAKSWSEVYEWAVQHSRDSAWARFFAEYCEIAEVKMVQDKYLTEGKLTKFSGIHFNNERPYTYLEAKRLLILLLAELKKDYSFLQKMKVDPSLGGRGAITGRDGHHVWDVFKLSKGQFRKHTHLTVVIGIDWAQAQVTVPQGLRRSIRRAVLGTDFENFSKQVQAVTKNMRHVFKLDPNVKPYIKVVQRHFKGQKSLPTEDAVIKYDLRTVFELKPRNGVKFQPEYLQASYDILVKRKKSNMQFEIGFEFPYQKSSVIKTAKAVKLFKEAFLALKPFVRSH